ncbi:hypothetical protein EVAR_85821_1 [Eumeta japonica]|uniref:Uncharacterized protein n=1 Tax=Eumeta variegata TaxID=151549 RepID=A0A4C1URM0_EUMVA|nr:hypothetical protein EVAR_85821_1 [Eumeta japonica]
MSKVESRSPSLRVRIESRSIIAITRSELDFDLKPIDIAGRTDFGIDNASGRYKEVRAESRAIAGVY